MYSYIEKPNPTPNIGDYFEGGYYTGMIWVQVAQSLMVEHISNGIKRFTIPSMIISPIVYEGQELEIRHRVWPNYKMCGTVVDAVDDKLTINVISHEGVGCYCDWSIMAKYRIIVAPKAKGEHSGIALTATTEQFPIGCQTLNDGWVSTNAMKHAGNAEMYPAAWWARSLNINGYDDWYIPARDELELCFRNLKPIFARNYEYPNRKKDASFSYIIDGAADMLSRFHGENSNSFPIGTPYSEQFPRRTSALLFVSTEDEAFTSDSLWYWSSSDYTASKAWGQCWDKTYCGNQSPNFKNNRFYVRAVRRSIV